ncbi:MAG TPA: Tol-Pal system subunit TolQ, partial [Hellea balneolensis]|nr:Tol-Pal system subunit TolQ [Hellea balneolensis]
MGLALFTTDVMTMAAAAPLGPQDFSYGALFMRADWVVKAIMIGLAVASIWSWGIIIDKFISMALLNRRANNFEETFWSGRTLDDLAKGLAGDTRDPMGRVFTAAMRELNESKNSGTLKSDIAGTRERVDRVMGLVVNR